MKVVPLHKNEDKHSIVYSGFVFKLDVIPRPFGCVLIYYTTDADECSDIRYVVGSRSVRRKWYDRFFKGLYEKRVLSSLKCLKQNILNDIGEDMDFQKLMQVIYEE